MHTVTVHGEGLVDLHVARRKCSVWTDTKRNLVLGLVHPGFNPAHLPVTKVAILGSVAFASHVVWVAASLYRTLNQPNYN